MTPLLAATADEVIEQIVVQCWVHQALDGDHAGARRKAERTLERLLSRGLPSRRGPSGGLLLDPYGASNALKSRAGEPADEAWADWQATVHRHALSLPAAPHLYRLKLRREWRSFAAAPGRQLVFRLPLPLRGAQRGPARCRLVEPADGLLEQREEAGRVELRVAPGKVTGPVIAELEVEFTAGDLVDDGRPSSPLGGPAEAEDGLWLRDREGLIAPSTEISAIAEKLAAGRTTAREFVHAAWEWLLSTLRLGDVHRAELDASAPLSSVLRMKVADCVLGSALLVALCRARGIPAKQLTGFLLFPENPGPHSWAEVKVAPGQWVPVDFVGWGYCAGDALDPRWGPFYRGRVDARFLAEVAPREFTGWGSAQMPAAWYRFERVTRDGLSHTLHASADGALLRRDDLAVELLGQT